MIINNNQEKFNLSQFVGKLKTEDIRYAKLSKGLQTVYWVLIPVYLLLAILTFIETKEIFQLVGYLCFIISFVIFALFFRKYYKEYNYVDYSLPTIKMLKKAVCRYKPFQLKAIWILIALLFMDTGLSIMMSVHFSVSVIQVYFIGAMSVAVLIGLIIWYIKYKPLYDNAKHLISEIEGG